jgi:SAM-dependent methyltransferase
MKQVSQSRGRAYFDCIYAQAEDPWDFRSSPYEREKYAATIAALPRSLFEAGLEVGCSIGELSLLLAPRCKALLGVDTAAAPLKLAQTRCAEMPHVRFAQMHVPAQWPDGKFDLIVLSEVLYFLAAHDIMAISGRGAASLAAQGVVMLVNWLGRTDDPCTGDEAADRFIASIPQLGTALQQRQNDYRIDVLAS